MAKVFLPGGRSIAVQEDVHLNYPGLFCSLGMCWGGDTEIEKYAQGDSHNLPATGGNVDHYLLQITDSHSSA